MNSSTWKVSGLRAVICGFFCLAGSNTTAQSLFDDPLLDGFNDILFVERGVYANDGGPGGDKGGQHQCTHYYHNVQIYKGGLYILKNFKSENRSVINVLENSVVQNGRLQGQKLEGGAFMSPDLSYDAKEVLFSWCALSPNRLLHEAYVPEPENWTAETCFHIFKVNVDGTNLVQLTDGPWNDIDPCWLPNGRIVFISERTEGRGEGHFFSRCFRQYVPQFTMHSMKADGSDMYPISFHETDEWQPSVNNDGMIVYSRWDYVDRDANIAQHLWLCYPDGRDPRSYHGNYPLPYSTMEGDSFENGYYTRRPFGEWHVRAIPGSHKYIATAAAHHGEPYGTIILIDQSVEDDATMSQVEMITPEVAFPEAQIGGRVHPYGTPWPLSENLYICNYNNTLILLDRDGNRETIPFGGTPSDPEPPASGMIHFWSLDNGAGDEVGNRNGTILGNPVSVTGKNGNALRFDGVEDEISVSTITLTGDFSLMAWVNFSGTVTNADAIMGKKDNGTNLNFYQGRFRLYGGPGTGDVVTASTTLGPGSWAHVAVTRSGSTIKLYMNGVQEATGTWSGTFEIDHIASGSAGYLEGILDDVRIYNSAVTFSGSGATGHTVPAGLRPMDPIPIMPRTPPPVIPTATYQGERFSENSPNATISIMNVRVSDFPIPDSVNITALRIVQYFPKSSKGPYLDRPDIGYAGESLARIVLGTVPVEADGSVYFKAPVNKGISFQLIDDKGMAVQLMRSLTYVHPGEQMTCTGCHESKWEAIPITPNPLAMQRPPSDITPEVGGLEPINFHRLVKPVLEAKCGSCHNPGGQAPDMTYQSLRDYAFWSSGNNRPIQIFSQCIHVPKHGGSRSMPMKHGAYGSPLYQGGYLSSSHYDVNLTAEELRRITMWMDCNSNELGAYDNEAGQRNGELVWPVFDIDPADPQGIEKQTPAFVEPEEKEAGGFGFHMSRRSDRVTITFPAVDDYTVTLSDPAGRILIIRELKNRNQFSFSVSGTRPGIYVVQTVSDAAATSRKLVVIP